MYTTVSLGLHDLNFPIRWWTWGSVQTSVTPTLLWTNGLVAATTGLTYAPWRGMHTNPDTTVLLIVPLWKSMMRGAMWSRCHCTAVSFELQQIRTSVQMPIVLCFEICLLRVSRLSWRLIYISDIFISHTPHLWNFFICIQAKQQGQGM